MTSKRAEFASRPAPLIISGVVGGVCFLALGFVVTSWARLVSFAASAAILAVAGWTAKRLTETPDDVGDLSELRRAFAKEADEARAADAARYRLLRRELRWDRTLAGGRLPAEEEERRRIELQACLRPEERETIEKEIDEHESRLVHAPRELGSVTLDVDAHERRPRTFEGTPEVRD
jgi:hypothetical protein